MYIYIFPKVKGFGFDSIRFTKNGSQGYFQTMQISFISSSLLGERACRC